MRRRILLVEDNELQQSLIETSLLRLGHEVEIAADGLDAVWRIREGRFDLVLLDYDLPEMDGLAAARLVQDIMGDEARPSLLALTATPEEVLGRERPSSPAFDGVIAKSMGLSHLVAAVEEHLRRTPDRLARKAAENELLLEEWAGFDLPLTRPSPACADVSLGRVLVVEDDLVQRQVLHSALTREHFEVESCADGLTAVRKMRATGFDVALIDYELPEVDGLTAARLIGSMLTDGVRPRLIALTNAPERLAGRSETAAAFEQVIAKENGLAAVMSAVRRALGRPETV